MTGKALARVAEEMMHDGTGLSVTKGLMGLTASLDGAPVITITPVAEGVLISLRRWLGARPAQSAKLLHVKSDDEDWESLFTASEWHVRGVLSRALPRIEARLNVSQRLAAQLEGRVRTVELGPHTPEFWKEVARWGKQTGAIRGSDRRFAWMYAERLERRLEVSVKYEAWAQRKAKEVVALGFVPPTKDVPA